jgi:2-C-methyl-D-erythritol 4-phosphate cytidylyltransferase
MSRWVKQSRKLAQNAHMKHKRGNLHSEALKVIHRVCLILQRVSSNEHKKRLLHDARRYLAMENLVNTHLKNAHPGDTNHYETNGRKYVPGH